LRKLERRKFISLLSGAAAWPLLARAQQVTPIIGFLHAGSPEQNLAHVAAFCKGLSESGYVDGRNVEIEYRWAAGRDNRLAGLAADLVRRRVTVIATPGTTQAALAAKAASSTIPIVFSTGADPVALGLVNSFNRPGGNITGVVNTSTELLAKRLGLLRTLVPQTTRVAALVNPKGPLAEATLKELNALDAHAGPEVQILYASTIGEIDAAITSAGQPGAALLVTADALFTDRRAQIIVLAARHALPAVYSVREFAVAGGLMSYGPSFASTYEQVGVYCGRILKREKPSDLPVVQASTFELVVNLSTAKTLGLSVPPQLLALADETIE
jgi:putative ABC transport system substrate-binding protein